MINKAAQGGRRIQGIILTTLLFAASANAARTAGVKLDGSIGGAAQVLSGPTYHITQSLGQLGGGNLFFSFQYFNIGTGETALFSTTSSGIKNVISRVTDGYSSTIDGTIRLLPAYGSPNFFLINPAGVTFTAHAAVDVPAAFYVSTANYVKFSDGNFYSDPTKKSTLSAAVPEAFGFLGKTRAPVDVIGATLMAGASGQGEFQIVAGDVTIDGGGIDNTTGGIGVIGVGAQASEVPIAGTISNASGTVAIEAGGAITSEMYGGGSAGAGNVSVAAGAVSISGAGSPGATGIFSDTSGNASASGGRVSVTAGTLSIDGGTGTGYTEIASDAGGAATGASIAVTVNGASEISRGAKVVSSTFGRGAAGDIALMTGSLTIDGANLPSFTGLSSQSEASGNAGTVAVTVTGPATIANGATISSTADSTGNSGNVALTVTGATQVSNGAQVSTSTFASGNAGDVAVTTGSLSIDGGTSTFPTGIASNAEPLTTGNAGSVSINVSGATTLTHDGQITADTYSIGTAGNVTLKSGSLTIDDANSLFTGISSSSYVLGSSGGNAGSVAVTVGGTTRILNGGVIATNTFNTGNAGDVTLTSGALIVDGTNAPSVSGIQLPTGLSSAADEYSTGDAGRVTVTVSGATTLVNGGALVSATQGSGNAGDIELTAASLTIDDSSNFTSITGLTTTAYPGSSGNAGHVSAQIAGKTTISDGGEIASATYGSGTAGDVTLTSGSLSIDGAANSIFITGLASTTQPGATGSAGRVSVTVTGPATISNGGTITSDTNGSGQGGDVTLVSGTTTISNGGAITSDTYAGGAAGDVTLTTSSLTIDGVNAPFTGLSTTAQSGSTGNAGRVSATVSGTAILSDGGSLASVTFGSGTAGNISLTAGALAIDGGNSPLITGLSSNAEMGSTGNAGRVSVQIAGTTTIADGGSLTSVTSGGGAAGDVALMTGSLTIDGANSTFLTGLSSAAESGSGGSAGHVSVTTPSDGTIQLVNGGKISSEALINSGGQPGTITIDGGSLILEANSRISIEDDATVANPATIKPSQIDITAGNIQMNNGQITARSTGNVGASGIDITYTQALHLDPSAISTSSVQGNGGPILITGRGPLWLDSSQITTSVSGTNGNGGDINITAPTIIMDTAAIQANTAAAHASGGDVTIDAGAILPSFQSAVLGGTLQQFDPTLPGFNLVQAAAPNGVSGALNVTSPTLDIGSSLLALTGRPAVPMPLGRSACGFTRGSSLSVVGRGGLPSSAYDPLWTDVEDRGQPAAGNLDPLRTDVSSSSSLYAGILPCRW